MHGARVVVHARSSRGDPVQERRATAPHAARPPVPGRSALRDRGESPDGDARGLRGRVPRSDGEAPRDPSPGRPDAAHPARQPQADVERDRPGDGRRGRLHGRRPREGCRPPPQALPTREGEAAPPGDRAGARRLQGLTENRARKIGRGLHTRPCRLLSSIWETRSVKREPAQCLPARHLTRRPDPRRGAVAVLTLPVASLLLACSSGSSAPADAGPSTPVSSGEASLAAGNWQGALGSCVAGEKAHPDDCNATYCEFIARTMMVVDEINSFLLPRYRRPLAAMPGDVQSLGTTNMLLAAAEQSADTTIGKQCQIDLPARPLLIGDKADPVVSGEVRGLW